MNTREWALLIFTILAQLSVGMMLVLLIVRTYAVGKLGAEKAAQLTELPFYSIVPIMVLSLIASLFHLGKVMHIIGAVPNLATSWMSREVVFAVTFMVLTAVLAFLMWRKIGSASLWMIVGWITAVVGLVLIYCMGMTYMLPSQPAWNSMATPINFYLTALLLGVLGTAVVMMISYRRMQKDTAVDGFVESTLRMIAVAGTTILGLQFLVLPLYMAYLGTQGPAAIQTLKLMFGTYGVLLALRVLFVFVGAGVLAVYLYRRASVPGEEKMCANLAYSAFALVLVGEILARFLFYATHYRIGI